MALPEPYAVFLEPLEKGSLSYCVTGSVASGIYGEPRLTKDIDFVLLLTLPEIKTLREIFPEAEYYVPPTEVLIIEVLRDHRGCLNLYHHRLGFKADIFLVVRDPLHLWAMEHKRRLVYDHVPMWVAPPEYVILRKLEAHREGSGEKHIRDIRHMLEVTHIDRPFTEAHVARLGLQLEWEEALEAHRLTGGGPLP